MATSRKIGFFLRKKPRSPTGERARNVLRTTLSVSLEIARNPARHPALAAGRCLPRVCVCGGARWACQRVVRMRVSGVSACARAGRAGRVPGGGAADFAGNPLTLWCSRPTCKRACA